MKPVGKQIEESQIKCFGHIVRDAEDEPTRLATFTHDMQPNIGNKQRVGRPRQNLIIAQMKNTFELTKTELNGKHKQR